MNKFIFSYPAKVYFGEERAVQDFSAELGKVGLEDFIRGCGLPAKMSPLKSTVEITPEVQL